MTTPLKPSEIDEYVAAQIEADYPAEAALLRSRKKPGRKKANGHTDHNIRQADLWCEIDDRIRNREFDGDVIADIASREKISCATLWELRDRRGRPAIDRILKERGRI